MPTDQSSSAASDHDASPSITPASSKTKSTKAVDDSLSSEGEVVVKKKRRRAAGTKADAAATKASSSDATGTDNADAGTTPAAMTKTKTKTKTTRTAKATGEDTSADRAADTGSDAAGDHRGDSDSDGEPRKKRRRRRRGSKGRTGNTEVLETIDDDPEPERDSDEVPAVFEGDLSPEIFALDTTFADLNFAEPVIRALDGLGFRSPTHVQKALAPVFLAGKDAMAQAKTGTGKTAAFGLPLLSMVTPGEPFQALILAPTRELAVQIKQDLGRFAKHTKLGITAIYGGQPIKTQAAALEKRPEIIVGTPGRVMDMVGRGYLRLDTVRFAILDELDRMLDIGFREDIRKIMRMCPEDRQSIMVSATIAPEIEDLARTFMNDPQKVTVTAGSLTVELVKQHFITCEAWDKRRLLTHLLTHEEPALTLVFCRMKRTVDKVVEHLEKHGIEAHAIHGDMSQGKRNRTMQTLRKGQLAVLIASDLASRGLDVNGITHVINYDLPEDPDVYVHRIGRTARIGRDGYAWSFAAPYQSGLLRDIEDLIGMEIPEATYPDFTPSPKPTGWRDPNLQAGQLPITQRAPKKQASRFEAPPPPKKTDVESNEKLAAKFPGGVVPSKKPPKLMRGKVRGRR